MVAIAGSTFISTRWKVSISIYFLQQKETLEKNILSRQRNNSLQNINGYKGFWHVCKLLQVWLCIHTSHRALRIYNEYPLLCTSEAHTGHSLRLWCLKNSRKKQEGGISIPLHLWKLTHKLRMPQKLYYRCIRNENRLSRIVIQTLNSECIFQWTLHSAGFDVAWRLVWGAAANTQEISDVFCSTGEIQQGVWMSRPTPSQEECSLQSSSCCHQVFFAIRI